MTVLNRIVARNRAELKARKEEVPLYPLLDEANDRSPQSLVAGLRSADLGIIAEIKYSSPSHGPFRCRMPPTEIAAEYVDAGAAAISILTERIHFDGRIKYLREVSESQPETPLLRKDFIFDRYQLAEAAAAGASAALLIVAMLDRDQLQALRSEAMKLGLEVLVEVHDDFELDRALESGAQLIGVNNRNLSDFEVDVNTSFKLIRRVEGEEQLTLVAESGLSERSQLLELKDAGFKGFLIGSSFMDEHSPGRALERLLNASEAQ